MRCIVGYSYDRSDQLVAAHNIAAPVEGRRVRLRPARNSDGQVLYELSQDLELNARVKFRGAVVSPEAVAASMWDSVLAQFVIEGALSHGSLGLFVLSSPDFPNRTAHFSVVGLPHARSRGLLIEGAALGINYAFHTWDFRKLYAEVMEFNLEQFASGLDKYFTLEGRRIDHEFAAGRYWDQYLLAVSRERWQQAGRRLVDHITRPGGQVC